MIYLSRPLVLINGKGGLKVSDDAREQGCYVCARQLNVRFVQFHGAGTEYVALRKEPSRMFLRICQRCFLILSDEMAALDAQHGTRDAPG